MNKGMRKFARLSNLNILFMTLFFMMAGAIIVVFDPRYLWGIWIPLCFFAIPRIYNLCREVVKLEERIKKLEEGKQSDGETIK